VGEAEEAGSVGQTTRAPSSGLGAGFMDLPKKNTSINHFCPVAGCRTKAPHTDDKAVAALLQIANRPAVLSGWATDGLKELRDSICNDVENQRWFAAVTRLRQVDEIYVRTIYGLLLVEEDRLPHFLSEKPPNGYSALYDRVAADVYGKTGTLRDRRPGLYSGDFSAMDMLNHTAHVSFLSLTTARGIHNDPRQIDWQGYIKAIGARIDRLNTLTEMFSAGSSKAEVLSTLRSQYKELA
jgi:hypothetical protein